MGRRENTNRRPETTGRKTEVARGRKSGGKRRQQETLRARRLAREEGCRSWEHKRTRTEFEVGGGSRGMKCSDSLGGCVRRGGDGLEKYSY